MAFILKAGCYERQLDIVPLRNQKFCICVHLERLYRECLCLKNFRPNNLKSERYQPVGIREISLMVVSSWGRQFLNVVITMKCIRLENQEKMLSIPNLFWNKVQVVDISMNRHWNIITESVTIFIKTDSHYLPNII